MSVCCLVFLCLSLSFSIFLCLSLSFSLSLCLSLSVSLSLSPLLCPSLSFSVLLSLSLSVCAYAGAAARRARSLGDAAVFSPQGGGMLVLGAVGLFCLSGGELQAIKENRKQNRLAQKRRKNLLKADIVFCSCLFWWQFHHSSQAARKLSRADLQLLITAKEKEAAEAGEAQPTGASCGCSRTLGSTAKSCFRRLLELLTFISSAVQHHHRSLLFLTQAHIVLCHLLVTG